MYSPLSPIAPRRRLAVLATVTAAGGLLAFATQLPAAAVPPAGPGTWTTITTPKGPQHTILSQQGDEGSMAIAGRASSGVGVVNVYCLRDSGSAVSATTVATSVPVSAGAFAVSVPVPEADFPQCRLRALPSGVSTHTDYLASYAGPRLDLDTWQSLPENSFQLDAATGNGAMEAGALGACNLSYLATVEPDEVAPGGISGCYQSLPERNVDNTHSTIRVDGHEAFTPTGALDLGITPATLASTSFHADRNGRVRWTETVPIGRCPTDVTFPPSHGDCPTLVSSGIELRQTSTYLPGGHQVTMRTVLRSLDGKRHTIHLDYSSLVEGPDGTVPGYRFPGQPHFHAGVVGGTVSGLGHGAGTLLIRNDLHSSEGNPVDATGAVTWSRTPSSIHFEADNPASFGMTYSLRVPKGGTARLGFTVSDGVLTTQASALAVKAEAGMMPAPQILSPANGARIVGTKTVVKGVVTAGANGLPAVVAVNGHPAKVRPKGATKETFSVTFHEPLGKHGITATTTDGFGNKRSASITVKNIKG